MPKWPFTFVFYGAAVLTSGTYGTFASTETVIYNLPPNADATGRLMQLTNGALLGTSYYGGKNNDGFLYQLIEKHGTWRGRIVYNFSGNDGENPFSGLTESNNVLYGTTRYGGLYGWGTAFSLVETSGHWSESNLYSFTSGTDGDEPDGRLIVDHLSGTLFGTASSNVSGVGCGDVFSYAPDGTFTVLYAFLGGADGCIPETRLVFGLAKNSLIGSTDYQGKHEYGTVFELRNSNGTWVENPIHQFTGGADGGRVSDLVNDQLGDVFGVTGDGGTYGQGVVFEISKASGKWRETVLHSFTGGADGGAPVGLLLDKTTGTLYGTTSAGGTYGLGTAFELVPGATWTEHVLHSFGGSGDGSTPITDITQDKTTGNFYGTTAAGGIYGSGVVYMITP